MNKAVEAFRTISEVAAELDVPKHVLRFWEAKFPHIRPMKRGGGRRYYRPEDMELLRGIRHLLHAEGYTIKGVQKILREQGVDQVKHLSREAAAAAAAPAAKRGRKATPRYDEREKAQPKLTPSLATIPSPPSRTSERRARVEAIITELEACRRLLTEETVVSEPAAPRVRRTGSTRG
jgi:DNA-binding transcriptional MerR regulator